jgi:serine/threonine protein kinase
MPLGSLSNYISKNKEMPWSDRHQIMLDIAEGMAFLHSDSQLDGTAKQELFHQDMKSGNVLLTVSNNALRGKISDFGLAFLRDLSGGDASSNVQLNGGTKHYQAPELYKRDAQFNKKADGIFTSLISSIRRRSRIYGDCYTARTNGSFGIPTHYYNSRINFGQG